jgi:hypothetical protein
MQMVRLDCPACGAHLPPKNPCGTVSCEYCGTSFQAVEAKAARTVAGEAIDPAQLAQIIASGVRPPAAAFGPPAPPSVHPSPAGTAIGRSGCVTLVFVFVAAFGVLPAVVGLYLTGALKDLFELPSLENTTLSREHRTYDQGGGVVQPVEIDGKPAFVCRTRAVRDGDQLFVGTYDETGRRLGEIGSLGSYGTAYRAAHFVAHGRWLVLTNAEPELRVHDLQSGETLQTFSLTDRVARLCLPPDAKEKNVVWVEQHDERSSLLDLEAATLEESERPEWCAERRQSREVVEGLPTTTHAIDDGEAPDIDGMRARTAFVEGDNGLVLGARHPGTAIPMIAGYDPSTKKTRYSHELATSGTTGVREGSAEYGALMHGRFFATYGSGEKAWHLTAFDAESGKRLWNVTLRPIFAVDRIKGLLATEDHVVVSRMSSVEIYRASDGTLLGTIGEETYQ